MKPLLRKIFFWDESPRQFRATRWTGIDRQASLPDGLSDKKLPHLVNSVPRR